MTWSTPYTFSAFEVLTAAMMNAIQDNIRESAAAKVTTAGDLAYATGANALARLALGSAGQVLKAGATAPEWGTAPGRLHAIAYDEWDAGGQAISTLAHVDITNATLNIVTTKTCTLVAMAAQEMKSDSTTHNGHFEISIDGTTPAIQGASGDQLTASRSTPGFFRKIGVIAGTITCKLRGFTEANGWVTTFYYGHMIILAFEE